MKQNSIRLSIIIPMYQASMHIKECLNSILDQHIKMLEIICVDDGSTDETVDIVEDMVHLDSRIKLYQTKHLGVSNARNIGIDQAGGNYLLFLDADDRLCSGKLSGVLKKAEKKHADILIFSGTTNFPYSTPLWIRDAFSAPNRYYSAFFPELLIQEKSCRPSACNKLYRKEYICSNHYYFSTELPIAEDHVFQLFVFLKAKNITFSRTRLYYYRINQSVSTMTYYNKKIQDRIKNHQKAMRIVAENWNKEGYLKNKSFQKTYITIYLDLLFGDLYQCNFEQRIKFAKEFYKNLSDIGILISVKDPIDEKKIKILSLYRDNKIQEGEQMLWNFNTRNLIQKLVDKLCGPIRYIRRIGFRSTMEHYIGRILHTEP